MAIYSGFKHLFKKFLTKICKLVLRLLPDLSTEKRFIHLLGIEKPVLLISKNCCKGNKKFVILMRFLNSF